MRTSGYLAGLLTVFLFPGIVYSSDPIVPVETIRLFDGKSLDQFYTWLINFHKEDPFRVFSVVDQIDGAPAIRISGEYFGGLTTRQNYANYHLIVECRWGEITWKEKKDAARDSGILIHGNGADGSYMDKAFNGPWMRSIEYQIIEGGMGDMLVLGGYEADGSITRSQLSTTVNKDRDEEWVWDPQGMRKIFNEGRINWFGRDVDWSDTLGFRGNRDLESPLGQWTRLEAICRGNTLTYLVNGTVVNEAQDLDLSSGKILFQSEGAEIYFRRIDLNPLPDLESNP